MTVRDAGIQGRTVVQVELVDRGVFQLDLEVLIGHAFPEDLDRPAHRAVGVHDDVFGELRKVHEHLSEESLAARRFDVEGDRVRLRPCVRLGLDVVVWIQAGHLDAVAVFTRSDIHDRSGLDPHPYRFRHAGHGDQRVALHDRDLPFELESEVDRGTDAQGHDSRVDHPHPGVDPVQPDPPERDRRHGRAEGQDEHPKCPGRKLLPAQGKPDPPGVGPEPLHFRHVEKLARKRVPPPFGREQVPAHAALAAQGGGIDHARRTDERIHEHDHQQGHAEPDVRKQV